MPNLQVPSESGDMSCHLQQVEMGTLVCKARVWDYTKSRSTSRIRCSPSARLTRNSRRVPAARSFSALHCRSPR